MPLPAAASMVVDTALADVNDMDLSQAQIDDFNRHGFVLAPNPLDAEAMAAIDQVQRDVEPEWKRREWTRGFNVKACQFFMAGEPLLQLAERPDVLSVARRLLDCHDIHVGACGFGDTALVNQNADGRPQLCWHADGDPDIPSVSFRLAMDRHGPDNAPLRVLPGSHQRPREEVMAELRRLERAAGGRDGDTPERCFARHRDEVAIELDPRSALVWTPRTWHATGRKSAPGPRRAISWNYYPPGGRTRDIEALKQISASVWEQWSVERKKLWGLPV